MASGTSSHTVEKSYLASAVESINPWGGSRSSTPTPKGDQRLGGPPAGPGDHSTNRLYGRSLKNYPPDCPPLSVLWFHAVDVPKRKPQLIAGKRKTPQDEKPPVPPKKFAAFSQSDSRSIELVYQKMLEQAEENRAMDSRQRSASSDSRISQVVSQSAKIMRSDMDWEPETRVSEAQATKVPVNEDFLFDVNIEDRELAPVYWLGPVYEIRRGTWFYQEGSTLRPCEENLAAQLEEGYLKVKPWLYPPPRPRGDLGAGGVTSKASSENLTATAAAASAQNSGASGKTAGSGSQPQPQSYRLFGTYMNSSATYQDSNTAWLSSDGMLSWVTSTMYERFAGGGYMSGIKLIRGYSDPGKSKDKDEKRPSTPTESPNPLQLDERQQGILKRRSAPPSTRASRDERPDGAEAVKKEPETRESQLQRHLSSLIEGSDTRNRERHEEELRKRAEQEISGDYTGQDGETQGREIEHLILVTHGIGQVLGFRMENINFVHDVNMLRKTFKSVYSQSADLRALNSEIGSGPGNCRIQVLPVCWRHLLDFPKKREKKGEHDLGDVDDEDDKYPSLDDITIEGMAFARSLISDLALDVLLYQSAYREQIIEIVLKESNRIYKLFMERNPEFKGKIHMMGHSLGSAILFDLLCRQREKPLKSERQRNPLRFWPSPERPEPKDPKEWRFDFDVDDFYCLGSPVGLFQMLKGRTIGARHSHNSLASESLNRQPMDDLFLTAPAPPRAQRVSAITGLPFSISSPKVAQLFNIFHPSDPISYRLEPLISPAMSSLKPQALPYTKKGIFGTVAPQGLTGIGMRVGQSVSHGMSELWSSLSSGIASSLLNRSLGLTNEDVAKMNASAAGDELETTSLEERTNQRKRQLASVSSGDGTNANGDDMTLIDDDLETLYSKFQKRRLDVKNGDGGNTEEWVAEERKARKLRLEEAKVRALNRNGRVDYSIQESVLDFNPINTIASHMGYWADEDVSHFILSQLLSRKR